MGMILVLLERVAMVIDQKAEKQKVTKFALNLFPNELHYI